MSKKQVANQELEAKLAELKKVYEECKEIAIKNELQFLVDLENVGSEYGYTFDQISDMSMREVCIGIKNINIRKYNDVAAQANMHGIKMPPKQRKKAIKASTMSKVEQDAIDRAIAERFKKHGK